MNDLIYSFLYSPAWNVLNAVAILWGSLAAVWLLFDSPKTRKHKWIVWGGIAVLAFAVLFSMVFEELLPLARRSPWTTTARVGLGMAGFPIAVAMLIYGGRLILIGTFRALSQAGTDQFPGWFSSWWPGLRWTLGAIVLFFVSTLIYEGVWLK